MKLMEAIKKHLVSILIVIASAIGHYTWTLIQKGGEAEFTQKVEKVFEDKLKDPRTFQLLLESKEIKEFTADAGEKIRNNIIEDVTKSDTNKISMRSYLGKEIGERDELVLPMLAELLKAYKDGNLMTQKDVEDIIRRRGRVATF